MGWNAKGLLAAALLAASAPLLAQSQATEDNWEGLVRVRSEKIELVYLAPGADFRPYTKVTAILYADATRTTTPTLQTFSMEFVCVDAE